MHLNLRAVLAATTLCLGASPAFGGATPIYVNQNAPPGGDGTSWATAYRDLHDALDHAVSLQAIWIAQGTYTPHKPALGIFRPPQTYAVPGGVHLYGGFAGDETSLDQRDTAAHPTILSGDINADDTSDFGNRADNTPYVVQIIESHNNVPTLLDGLIINASWIYTDRDTNNRPGTPLTISNCRFQDHSSSSLAIRSRELTLTDTTFTKLRDTAQEHRGFQIGYRGVSRIERCTFDKIGIDLTGQAAMVDCEFRDCGIGAYNEGAILNSRWIDDPARLPGVGAAISGALIDTEVVGDQPKIFLDGYSGLLSGGNFNGTRSVELYDYSNSGGTLFHDCHFSGEYEYHMFSTYDGGKATFQRCSFTDMTWSKANYGAMNLDKGPFVFEDCLFARNQGSLIEYYNGHPLADRAALEFHRCRFLANTGDLFYIIGASILFDSSVFLANATPSTLISCRGLAVSNCTFAFNRMEWNSPVVGVSFADESSVLQVRNSAFWRNGSQDSAFEGSPLPTIDSPLFTVVNCLGATLDTSFPNAGNISADPLFVDPLGPDALPATGDEDLHLQHASPCIDAGVNDIDIDPFTPGIRPPGSLDADGRPRIWTTNPEHDPIVDIGSFEFGAPTLTRPVRAPELMFPFDASPHVGTRPILVWTPVPGSNAYRVEIARNADMNDIIADELTTTRPCIDAKSLHLPPDATLWWRVTAIGDKLSLTSPIRSFSTSIPPAPRGDPPAESDLNNDCRVDYHDLELLINMMRFVPGPVDQYSRPFDINRDELLNGADLSILLAQYGQTCTD